MQGACEGDEGGPLYINAKINDNTGDINNRTLAGIFSGSGKYDCGKSEINYWQRVSEFLPWIKCVKRNAEENKPTEEFEKECASEINSSRNKCSRWSQPLETSPFKPSGVNFGAWVIFETLGVLKVLYTLAPSLHINVAISCDYMYNLYYA